MRYLNILLMLLMVLFIVVQYNDPDGPLWMIIYAVPAIWAAIAAFRPKLLASQYTHFFLLFCLFAAIGGVIYFWPTSEGWWRQEVWWEAENAREGMGMMIVAIVLLVAWLSRPSTKKTDK